MNSGKQPAMYCSIAQHEKIRTHRTMIMEMIEASMEKAREKGPHPLTPGCNCMACVIAKKRILHPGSGPWPHRL